MDKWVGPKADMAINNVKGGCINRGKGRGRPSWKAIYSVHRMMVYI